MLWLMCVELEEVMGIREIPKIQLKRLGQTQVVYTTKAARLEEWLQACKILAGRQEGKYKESNTARIWQPSRYSTQFVRGSLCLASRQTIFILDLVFPALLLSKQLPPYVRAACDLRYLRADLNE